MASQEGLLPPPEPSTQAGSYRGHRSRWSTNLRRITWAWEPPLDRATRVWLPLVALVAGIGSAILMSGQLMQVAFFLLVYHLPVGMYTGVTSGVVMGLDMALVIFIVTVLHIFGGLFVVWNADALKTVPWLGPYVRKIEARGHKKWKEHPRLRDFGVLGVAIFTVAPIPGTGILSGALVGRLIGLPWFPTFLAVVIAGMTRVLTITFIVYGVWEFTPWS